VLAVYLLGESFVRGSWFLRLVTFVVMLAEVGNSVLLGQVWSRVWRGLLLGRALLTLGGVRCRATPFFNWWLRSHVRLSYLACVLFFDPAVVQDYVSLRQVAIHYPRGELFLSYLVLLFVYISEWLRPYFFLCRTYIWRILTFLHPRGELAVHSCWLYADAHTGTALWHCR
jgi:hypothetical protein